MLLDLFCGAGGAARGYADAGFDVIGVDSKPQPNYPYEFFRADVLEHGRLLLDTEDFAAIHASPPCQGFSALTPKKYRTEDRYPNLLPQTRTILHDSGLPYVIENVKGAPLIDPIVLCGSHFDLRCSFGQLQRHRYFESNILMSVPGPCRHTQPVVGIYGHPGGTNGRTGKPASTSKDWAQALQVDWMTSREMAQALPPAYTNYIGRQIIRSIDQ